MKTLNLFSFGNTKLPKSTAIFNLGTATDCPSAKLGLCKIPTGKCYALKAERMYKQVIPYRLRQMAFWSECTPESFVAEFIATVGKKAVKYLRFNEAGDFYGQPCVDKMSAIADLLKAYGIKCYVYTAREDLDFSNTSDNLTVNGSGFMVDNCFCPPVNMPENTNVAECLMDCRKCNKCAFAHHKFITVPLH